MLTPHTEEIIDSSIWREGRLGQVGEGAQIIFAQVREDASIELELLRLRPANETVVSIASGGCTAFTLLLANPAQLYALDINPMQIHLVELKKAALENLSPPQIKLCWLSDATPFYPQLREKIGESARAFWDSHAPLLALGLNQCGVIEQKQKEKMRFLPLVQSAIHIRRLFRSKTLREQRRVYLKSWNTWQWKLAFRLALSKPALLQLYGPQFVEGMPPHFARDLKKRFDDTILNFLARDNPHLWQILRSTYPPHESGWPLYLQTRHRAVLQENLKNMHLECADAVDWLQAQQPCSIGFFALSNILEVASPEFASRLLQAVARAAKPDALVLLRSLNAHDKTWVDELPLESGTRLQQLETDSWEVKDQSFFCTHLQIIRVLK